MLAITNITKSYGSLVALDGLSLDLAPGEFFGLLGPNGAGKTTLMSLLAGLRTPDAGSLKLDGEQLSTANTALRQSLGLVPQNIALYTQLSAEDNLKFFGRLYGLNHKVLAERMDEGLTAVGLQDRRRDKVGAFSGGMQRRLNLIAGLLHRPRILLCDEPTVGVDPQSRNAIFEFLEAQNRAGLTVVYSTHYMEEATRLCSRIGIIDHGQLMACDSLAGLLRTLPGQERIVIQRDACPQLAALPEAVSRFGTVQRTAKSFVLDLPAGTALSPVFAELESGGIPSSACELMRPDLEDVFLHLTGKTLRD